MKSALKYFNLWEIVELGFTMKLVILSDDLTPTVAVQRTYDAALKA